MHTNPHLQNIVNKHGVNNLSLLIVEICSSEILGNREVYWIEQLKPECNLVAVRSSDGTPHSKEWRLNMSVNNPSKRPEVRIMRSEQLKKYNPSRDSADVREKLRVSALKQFSERGHPMLGRRLSDETKRKISEAQKARLNKKK